MDQMVQHMSEENNNVATYTLPDMWQFEGSNNNGNGTSFEELHSSMQMDMNMNDGNVGIAVMNREHDPMVVDHCTSNGAVTFKKRPEDASETNANGKGFSTNSHGIAMFEQKNESDSKRMKTRGAHEHEESKREQEVDSGNAAEQTPKPPEASKQDYIHVRARRGQATDSHSLAERARREKISERMKILQDLVPGCNKVIGKALVLDEIINYIQSLQRQVEFLSMKLETVNSRVPTGIDGFPSKGFSQQQAFDTSSLGFSPQAARDYGGTTPEWLHMQLGGGFERTS